MKKMRNSKRGFTFSEITIVLRLLLSLFFLATFAGVAITLSEEHVIHKKNLKKNNGDNFEVSLPRSEVRCYQ